MRTGVVDIIQIRLSLQSNTNIIFYDVAFIAVSVIRFYSLCSLFIISDMTKSEEQLRVIRFLSGSEIRESVLGT